MNSKDTNAKVHADKGGRGGAMVSSVGRDGSFARSFRNTNPLKRAKDERFHVGFQSDVDTPCRQFPPARHKVFPSSYLFQNKVQDSFVLIGSPREAIDKESPSTLHMLKTRARNTRELQYSRVIFKSVSLPRIHDHPSVFHAA